jgi:hypothetical protein
VIPAGWHGTDDELMRLSAAIERQCDCSTAPRVPESPACGAHALLMDERVLDHLVYAYRMKNRLECSEWGGTHGTATTVVDWSKTS